MKDPRSFRRRADPLTAMAVLAAVGTVNQVCGCGGSGATGAGGASSHSSSSTTTSSAGAGGGGSTSSSTSSSSTTSSSSSSATSSGSGGGSCNGGPFQGTLVPGANGGFSDAFDAAPDSLGNTVYFTAIDPTGNPGVFKQGICMAGGAPMAIYTSDPVVGAPFVAPFGIAVSSDDATLFVADPGAVEDPTDPTKDKGVLFKLSAAGGQAPSHLVDSVGPRSLTVAVEGGADVVYFTGVDKANGFPGVFKVAAAGGAVSTVAEGAPFSDPAGIAVAANGDIYVLDTSGSGTGLANIIVIPKGGAATEFVPNIQAGYPGGIALMLDDSVLLASGLDPSARSNLLVEVTVATKAVNNKAMGVGAFNEAAGLHRAKTIDVFAWADTKARPTGLSGTGTVFVIK